MKSPFEKLYEAHVRTIYLYCLKRIRDESVAEDLTSDVFIRLYTHVDSVREGEELSWLCTVANHLCIDHWRKIMRERGAIEKIQTAGPAATHPPVDCLNDILNRCGRLNEIHKQLIRYRYVLGMRLEEIAAQSGKTPVQVKGYLQYARKLLYRAYRMKF